MNMDKKFEAYITPEKALHIGLESATTNGLTVIEDYYKRANAEMNKISCSERFCGICALFAIYVTGYISGARAVRRKNNITDCSKKRG